MFSKLKVLLSGVIVFAGITVEAVETVPSYQKAETKNELFLFRAIAKENIGLVQIILDNFEEIENIDAKIPEGMTPLHLAVEKGLLEIASLLLDRGADINAEDHLDRTPLHIAILLGDLEMVSLLLDRGADHNKLDNDLKAPLHLASQLCQKDIILRLLKEDSIEINIQQQVTWDYDSIDELYQPTPLEISIKESCEEGSLLLLENGAATEIDVFRTQHSPYSLIKVGNVLFLAVENRSSDRVIEAIIKNSSPDIFNATNQHGSTVLNVSARKGGKIFHKLLEYYENINLPNKYGNTPLHFAANEDVVSTLLKKQPSLACAENNRGDTPFHSFLFFKDHPAGMIKLLLEEGSGLLCIDKQDENGEAPLHIAARQGNLEAARILLENGANINVGTNEYFFGLIKWGGETPLDLPLLSGKMRKLLESY